MALTLEELISDIPDAIALIPKVELALAKLKAKPQTAETIMIFASEVLAAAASLAGKIEAQIKV